MKKSKFIGLALALFSAFALTGCNSQPVVGPQGPQGETGETGPQGPQGSAGQDGKDGVNGQDGNGIVSIELTDSSGNIDTYTITFDNGETTTFTVTNGENGEQGIQGEPGEDGGGAHQPGDGGGVRIQQRKDKEAGPHRGPASCFLSGHQPLRELV